MCFPHFFGSSLYHILRVKRSSLCIHRLPAVSKSPSTMFLQPWCARYPIQQGTRTQRDPTQQQAYLLHCTPALIFLVYLRSYYFVNGRRAIRFYVATNTSAIFTIFPKNGN